MKPARPCLSSSSTLLSQRNPEFLQGLDSVFGDENTVADGMQKKLRGASEHGFIIDHQNAPPPGNRPVVAWMGSRVKRGIRRQYDPKLYSDSHFALNSDGPMVFLDHAIDGRQAKAGAFSDRFSGEKDLLDEWSSSFTEGHLVFPR
jgi:hypothetical protein